MQHEIDFYILITSRVEFVLDKFVFVSPQKLYRLDPVRIAYCSLNTSKNHSYTSGEGIGI